MNDKERLDWVQKEHRWINTGSMTEWVVQGKPAADIHWRSTLRGAIDAAIRSEKRRTRGGK